jgi:thymidylate synthase (FAD)
MSTTMRVQLIGATQFFPPADVPWSTDADGGQALAEFAGRSCFQSWRKPNPATATNAGYLRHIIEVGHLSVLEHGAVSFYLTGISRSLTHELVRHRLFSYSQLSQRYFPEEDSDMVEPDAIAADPELHAVFERATKAAREAYGVLVAGMRDRFAGEGNATLRRKLARQGGRPARVQRLRGLRTARWVQGGLQRTGVTDPAPDYHHLGYTAQHDHCPACVGP